MFGLSVRAGSPKGSRIVICCVRRRYSVHMALLSLILYLAFFSPRSHLLRILILKHSAREVVERLRSCCTSALVLILYGPETVLLSILFLHTVLFPKHMVDCITWFF